jgi:Gas vesicle synthesis protein GvpL/GvpF
VTYLYCLVRSARKPAVRRLTAGVPGAAPVRTLDAGAGLWLIVSDVDAGEYSESAIAAGLKDLEWVSRRAMGHEAVVERFMRGAALLPMQLFTIFTSDERALAHVARERRRIDRMLARVEGHVEWGLRLTWDEQGARAAVEKAHGRTAGAARSGSAYLARKRDLLDVSRTQLADAREAASALHGRLSKQARDAVRRTSTEQAAPGARLLLDAAYLVPATRADAFRTAVRRAARPLAAAGVAAALTGPWPPYNFISSR